MQYMAVDEYQTAYAGTISDSMDECLDKAKSYFGVDDEKALTTKGVCVIEFKHVWGFRTK